MSQKETQVVFTRETLLESGYIRFVTTKLQGILKSLMQRQIIEIILKNIFSVKRAHVIETKSKKSEYDALRSLSRGIMNKSQNILC